MPIRYMMFSCGYGAGPLYFVGTDVEAMRKDARLIDKTADPRGIEVNSERVLGASTKDSQRRIIDDGVAAARSGTKSYYLFG